MKSFFKKGNCSATHRFMKKIYFSLFVTLLTTHGHAGMEDFVSVPPLLSSSEEAMVMLVMSNDNQLWHKAYTDYTDLDGDGDLDVSYNDAFVYYGYFDSGFCYSYNSSGYFEPAGKVVRPESETSSSNPNPDHKCTTAAGNWSGNFMNWLTMSRIDVIRKVLYGGFRITDTAGETILQRALLPDDNHSFVKVVKTADIDGMISNYTPIAGEAVVSFCNVTDLVDSTISSRSNAMSVSANPPKLKVAAGNYFTWSGSERDLCMYNEGADDDPFRPRRPGNVTGIGSQVEFNVRIKKCVSGQDQGNCRAYTDGTNTVYKPYGLIQSYGENGGLQFGLMTGSYDRNLDGGVLRKNVSYLGGSKAAAADKEIDLSTGVFINQGDNTPGIINTLDRLRIGAWDFNANFYTDCSNWSIPIADVLAGSDPARRCRDWGNPLSEIYLEALRYFSGQENPSTAFAADDSAIIEGLGEVVWGDPFTSDNYCSDCAIVLLSTGLNSFDADNLGSAADLPLLSGASSIDTYTNAVGVAEGIAGNEYLAGEGSSGGTIDTCDAKTISEFSDARGVCPEIPSLQGSYGLAGLAYYGFTEDVHDATKGDQKVTTYAVALAESLPNLDVATTSGESVTVVPYCIARPDIDVDTSYIHWPNDWEYSSSNPNNVPGITVPDPLTGKRCTKSWGWDVRLCYDPGKWGQENGLDCVGENQCADAADTIYDDPAISSAQIAASLQAQQDAIDDLAAAYAGAQELAEQQYADAYSAAESGVKWANCSLVDLTVTELTDTHGVFYISWEDSLWGSDNDMDIYSVVEYCTAVGTAAQVQALCGNFTDDADPNTPRPEWAAASTGDIQVRTAVVGASMGVAMRFGYVISGSTNNGTYDDLPVGNGGDVFFNSPALTGSEANTTLWSAAANKFTAAAGSPGVLQNPLWYAAKYGNFTDKNGNGLPDLTSEWDQRSITGSAGSDGIPDAYFPVRNPSNLETSLSRIFSDITARVSSGTAASVVSSTGAGEGAVFQALYNPVFEYEGGDDSDEISWVGTLHALFIDSHGQLREDVVGSGEQVGQLSNADPIVEIYYDDALKRTVVQRYLVNADGSKGAAVGSPVDVNELNPIWSARDQLSSLTNLNTNRAYNSSATTGRYIFTGIDKATNRDGVIDNSELLAFSTSSFVVGDNDNFYLLDYGSDQADLDNLVNYIRGDESISGFRSRSIEFDGNTANGDEAWLLGDIVNASPITLARPSSDYENTYSDTTYRDFKTAVADRRQVVFLGANDGMLHAFNAGFYDRSIKGYKTALTNEVQHPLGSELWAYVPYNLLPHLQYLTRDDYSHVYYVDGKPQIFDVNGIWDGDSKISHPNGWGNILVTGMRFGGGELTLDPDGQSGTDNNIKMRSAFIIMDVTDPESPPELIAEISDPDLGYTVSAPAVVKMRSKNTGTGTYESPAVNEWFLVFGSGPAGVDSAGRRAALASATSEKTAKLYAYNLRTRVLQKFDTNIANAFVGGVSAVDWNNDYKDDAVYFGLVGGTEAAPTGQLMRANLSLAGSSLSVTFGKLVAEVGKPFSAQPAVFKDGDSNVWVYSGTGRFYTAGDNSSNTAQRFYGVKDPTAVTGTATTVALADLVNTSEIEVYAEVYDGDVVKGTAIVARNGSSPFDLNTGESVASVPDIQEAVEDHDGWYFDLPRDRERNTTESVLSGESLVFTTYQPSGEQCNAEGLGFLYALHFQAGVPGDYAPIGTDSTRALNDKVLVIGSATLGPGSPSAPTIYTDGDGDQFAIVQTSTGAIVKTEIGQRPRKGYRQSWREIKIDW